MTISAHVQAGSNYELRFTGLFHPARDYAFPCDARGMVDLARLSERARASYLRVCAQVGREFLGPVKCIRCLEL